MWVSFYIIGIVPANVTYYINEINIAYNYTNSFNNIDNLTEIKYHKNNGG